MTKVTDKRSVNMDLLRVILTVMVVVLHLNNRDMGGALNLLSAGTEYEILIRFFQSAAICAVDAFVMLSGYFAAVRAESRDRYASSTMTPLPDSISDKDKDRDMNRSRDRICLPIRKAVFLLATCSFYRVTGYICYILLVTPGAFSIRTLIGYLIPNNWYVCLFVTLLLLSPYIVRGLESLADEAISLLTGLMLLLFCVVPMCVTMFGDLTGFDIHGLSTVTWQGDGMGFNIALFVTCFIVGYSLKRSSGYWNRFGAVFYLVMYILASGLGTAVSRYTESVWNYSSVIVVLEAAMLVLMFTRIDIRSKAAGKVLSALAGCSLGIFLWHTMPVMFIGLWSRFGIQESAGRGLAVFVSTVSTAVIAMYVLSAAWVLVCRGSYSRISRVMSRK